MAARRYSKAGVIRVVKVLLKERIRYDALCAGGYSPERPTYIEQRAVRNTHSFVLGVLQEQFGEQVIKEGMRAVGLKDG